MTSYPSLRRAFPEAVALRETLSRPAYVVAVLFVAVLVAFAYALLLPTLALDVTLQYLGFWVLAYLTPAEELIAGAMGTLLGLVVVLNVYLWKRRECRPAGSTAASVVGGVALNAMGSMICCGIIVPLVLSLFASGSALAASTNSVRSFFSTYALALYALSFAALWMSIRVTSRQFSSWPRSGQMTLKPPSERPDHAIEHPGEAGPTPAGKAEP